MRRIAPIAVAALISAGAARAALAQPSVTPPKILQVICETVKPGMAMLHDRNEEKWARTIESIKGLEAPALAIQSVTGPPVSCWLDMLDSYAQMGKINGAMSADAGYAREIPGLLSADAQFVSETRNYIAVLRPDLSGGAMPNVLTRRAMTWGEWRIRPGQEDAFAGALKAYTAAMVRAGVTPDFRVYEVKQGAPSAMFWIFSSRTSLAGFDADLANDPKIGGAITPDDGKLFADFFAKAVVSVNENLWMYNSAQSTLSAEQRATDAFWKRPVTVAKRP